MDNILLHLLIPILALRIISYFTRIDKKTILLLSPLAVFPDIDYFFGYHRATLHNVFVAAAVIILAVFAMRILFKERDWIKIAFVSFFYFAAHLIIDVGGVILFYPLTRKGIDLLGRSVRLEDLQGYHVGAGFFLFYGIGVLAVLSFLIAEVVIEERKKARK
ncbi:MAG: metal-dependent hydrolase [archaeon]